MDRTKSNPAIEIVQGRLYWISNTSPPKNHHNAFYFSIDNVNFTQELIYQPYCHDFGPLHLGMTHKFCVQLEQLLNNDQYQGSTIYHYCSTHPHKKANAAFLMGAFQVIVLKRTPDEAWNILSRAGGFVGFKDASFGGSNFLLPIKNCLQGLAKAIEFGWYDYETFNAHDYEFYERVENGDWNWIIPGKFLAFSSPTPNPVDPSGFRTWTPEDYAPLFQSIGVTAVVRLNQKTYEANRFKKLGVSHHDIYFLDGSCPAENLIRRFIDIAESEPGALAVHCKAGLGRTGTMIGCYVMKHYPISAVDFIGWIRIARPGSVLGPQQQFLCEMESKVKSWNTGSPVAPRHTKTSSLEMSPQDVRIAQTGDRGQAQRLMQAKMQFQSPGSRTGQSKGLTQQNRAVSLGRRKSPTTNIFRTNGVRGYR